jgi:phospholipid/cholesterol/gamma-HCH transport system substrate-binding protein
MVSGMREGKGTLGALMVDPSVYEDLKMLLGNIQRNQALRALVRYSIRRDGAPGVEVVDPEAPARPSPAANTPSTPAPSRARAPAKAARVE